MKGRGMATDNSAPRGIQLPWAGKKVHQEQVEEALSTLWHLAADNMRISQNMNVRTSVLNFVICTRDLESAHKVNALLRDLSSIHIARVTLLILDTASDAPSDISTWVTLRSFPIVSDMMRHHFEQVTVMVRGAAVKYAATVVQSLSRADLPVYLWWVDDLSQQEEIFQRFIAISSRAIVNSSHFSRPAESLQNLEQCIHDAANCAMSDLTWSRITALRELIAQFFDVPEYRPYLMGVNHITIEYTTTPTPAPAKNGASPAPASSYVGHPADQPTALATLSALFLAAWLKNRLGWQLSSRAEDNQRDHVAGHYGWYMTQRDIAKVISQPLVAQMEQVEQQTSDNSSNPLAGIQFIVRPRPMADSEPGTICLIRLHSTAQGQEAAFTIARGEDDDHVYTSAELPGSVHPQRTVSVADTHRESELLHHELEIMGRDHLYEETIQEVLSLLG
jgi:glucose-6-phosphate dehydrogenase assembly protein OpcA